MEKDDIRRLLEAAAVGGDVIIIGYDEKVVRAIAEHAPTSCTVLDETGEKHPELPNIRIESRWDAIGKFDTIIFTAEPPCVKAPEKPQIQEAQRLLKEEKRVAEMVSKVAPDIERRRYTDADLDTFFKEVGHESREALGAFIDQLHKQDQVTASQRDRCMTQYELGSKCVSLEEGVIRCLSHHLKKGGRLAAYIDPALSLNNHPDFSTSVITNPECLYEERDVEGAAPKRLMVVELRARR
jgi:hypothetical protein